MAEAKRDQNFVPSALGVSSSDGVTTLPLKVDPITGRLLVDSAGGGTGTVTEVDTGTGLTGGPITTTGTISLDSKLAPLDTLGSAGQSIRVNAGATALEYFTAGGGTGTVTSASVVSANGFAGTVANATTTPAITISTTITGILQGNGTAISAATTTGTGSTVVLATSPTLITPALGTPTALVGTNITGTASGLTAGTVTTNADLTGAITSSGNATSLGSFTSAALAAALTDETGSGAAVFAVSPALTGTPTAPTQTAGDNTTAIATDAFVTTAVANAIAGVNPAIAVSAATTASSDTSGFTYNNGVSGIGATLTQNSAAVYTVDGFTFSATTQRLLVKNDTQSPSGAFNGIYLCTTVGTSLIPAVFTRALDYDTPSDMNNTGAIPVVNGTANTNTSWLLTSNIATVGTSPLTYVQFSVAPSTIVIGPASATSGVPALFSGTSGKLIANSTPTGTGNPVMQTSPSLTTPTLGVATATSLNGNTFTTGTYTLTGTAAKTLNFTNSLTLSGTDSTTMTFPSTSASIARTDAGQTFTGTQVVSLMNTTPQTLSVTSNAATADINHGIQNFTNSSAAAMTITLTTTSAVDGQWKEIRIYDFSAVAEGITFVNTENSTVSVPTTSNGSTTLPLSVLFQFNGSTSKWRCLAVS